MKIYEFINKDGDKAIILANNEDDAREQYYRITKLPIVSMGERSETRPIILHSNVAPF